MDDKYQIVKLDHRPCCINYLEQYDVFIVGTYQLVDSTEEAARPSCLAHMNNEELKTHLNLINNRLGSFVLLKQDSSVQFKIIYQFECESDGGVFDFVVARFPKEEVHIYAAHSNGVLTSYKVDIGDDKIEINLTKQQDVPQTKMLTCIDRFITENPEDSLLVVGSSEGIFSVINDEKVVAQKICDTNDPIWQVKCTTLNSDKRIIFVGNETTSWYIYELKCSSSNENYSLDLLFKSCPEDYKAGITCIFNLDCDIHDDSNTVMKVLIGSYDETLKCYELVFTNNSEGKISHLEQVNLVSRKKIANGGIWRIKQINSGVHKTRQLYIAAMYAGCFKLNYEIDGQSFASADLTKLIDLESPRSIGEKPLHYDIDFSPISSTCCIADFNNSSCLIKYL